MNSPFPPSFSCLKYLRDHSVTIVIGSRITSHMSTGVKTSDAFLDKVLPIKISSIHFPCVFSESPYLYCIPTACIMEQVSNVVGAISPTETSQLQSASRTQAEITIEQLLTTTLNQLAEMRQANMALEKNSKN